MGLRTKSLRKPPHRPRLKRLLTTNNWLHWQLKFVRRVEKLSTRRLFYHPTHAYMTVSGFTESVEAGIIVSLFNLGVRHARSDRNL